MDGFKNIEINNYRGLKHLLISDFSRINIFLGHNNSGKSSILESLMLLTGMANPDIVPIVNSLRMRNVFTGFKEFSYMFYNTDINNMPEISSEQTDGIKRKLKMSLTFTPEENSQLDLSKTNIPSSETKIFLNTLDMNFNIVKDEATDSYSNVIKFNNQGIVSKKENTTGYLEKNSATFLPADIMRINLPGDLAELIKRKRKDLILDRLQKFDSRINAIELIINEVFIGFDGMTELLPINITGDGLRRYTSIVASSANPINNIVLIDEIDNGLHYSAYKKLWESIFALAVGTNKQIFITTHSKETLFQLYKMLEENAIYQNEFSLYTIEQTLNKGHQAYKYTFEEFKNACENDVELRSIVL